MKTFTVHRWGAEDKKVDTEIMVHSKSFKTALAQAGAVNPKLIHRSMGINLYLDQNGWQYGAARV